MQIEKLISTWMDFVVKRPIVVILGSLLACTGLMTGIPDFEIDTSVKRYIGEESDIVVHLNHLESEYIEDRNVLLMVKPRDGDVFTKQTVNAIAEMTEAAWNIPYLRRVDSLTNFQHTSVENDDLLVAELVRDASTLSQEELVRLREIALNESRLVGSLVSQSGAVAALNMMFTFDISDAVALAQVTQAVSAVKEDITTRYPNIELYESGYVTMMHHMAETAANDAKTIYSGSLAIILFFLICFFRSVLSAFAVMFIGMLSVITSIGFYGLVGGYLTPPTATAVLMVLILGVVDGIHIVKSAGRFLGQGDSLKMAVHQSIVTNFTPIGLTSITTAIGFLSFNLNDFTGIQMMGNYVAFGVMLAFFLSLTLLPALMCYCGLKPDTNQSKFLSYDAMASWVIKHNRRLFIGNLLLIIVSAYFISFNVLDDAMSRHLKSTHKFRQDTGQIEKDLTGMIPAIYSFESGKANGIADLDFMHKVNAFAQWVRQQPGTRNVSTYTDTMMQLNQDLNAGLKANYQLPQTKELAAQYLLLYELSLPYGLGMDNQINLDKSATRVVVNMNDMTVKHMKRYLQGNAQWLKEHAPEFDDFANSTILSGNLTVETSIWNTLVGALIALAIIGLFLIFTFRAISPGLLCMVTVVAPMIIAFGIWGLGVGVIDLPSTLALCMVIGISVDFSVHFISKYLHAQRQLNYDIEQSIRYTFNAVAAPVLTSTLALGLGFLIMIFGQFQFGARMGLLTAICIALSMLMVFTFLPSLLLRGKDK